MNGTKTRTVANYIDTTLKLPSSACQPIKESIRYKRTIHFRTFEIGVRWKDVFQKQQYKNNKKGNRPFELLI